MANQFKTVLIPHELHKQVKIAAIESDTEVRKFVEDVLTKAIALRNARKNMQNLGQKQSATSAENRQC